MACFLTLISMLLLHGGSTSTLEDCKSAQAAPKLHHVNDTNMTSVTVFVDRAEVTRELHLHFDALGPFSVVLQGLPESLELGSLRVEGHGQDLRILDVSDTTSRDSDKSIQALEQDLDLIRSKLSQLESNTTQLNFLMSLLEKYTKVRLGVDPSGARTVGNEIMGFDAAIDTFEFYTNRSQHLYHELSEVSNAKAKLVKEQMQAEHALKLLKNSSVRAAIVDAQLGAGPSSCLLEAKSQDIVLIFRYITRRASWSPSYDIQVRSGDHAVELVYYGNVVQSTGEDWKSVRLLLSTSDPSRALSPPLIRKRSIHFQSNIAAECDSEECMYLSRPRKRRKKQSALTAAAGSVLEIPRIVTIPSLQYNIASSRKIVINKSMLSARFAHYATPTVSPYAYLRATMNNTSPYPLLPSSGDLIGGTVRVFFDGGFVATSELTGIVGVNGTFTSFLGIDHGVKIHLDPEVQRYQSSLLGGDVTTFSSSTRVVNRKASSLYILIQNSVVQSMTDKIKVDVISPSALVASQADVDPFSLLPGFSKAHLDNQTGALNWAVCLGPNSEITLPLVFTTTTSRGRYVAVTEEADSIQFDRSSDAHMEL